MQSWKKAREPEKFDHFAAKVLGRDGKERVKWWLAVKRMIRKGEKR